MRQVKKHKGATMPNARESASLIAAGLPARDTDFDSDLISLQDIVITGVETGWSHFLVSAYRGGKNNGLDHPFAILWPIPQDFGSNRTGQVKDGIRLWPEVVRDAVAKYLTARLEAGLPIEEARRLVDGSYTDAVVADSILQFAVYGEEVYS